MKNRLLILLGILSFNINLFAQGHKPLPKFNNHPVKTVSINVEPKVDLASNKDLTQVNYDLLSSIKIGNRISRWKFARDSKTNEIIAGKRVLNQKNWSSFEAQAIAYLGELSTEIKTGNKLDFLLSDQTTSSTGTHIRFSQTYEGIQIDGSEGILHATNNIIYSFTGRVKSDFSLNPVPTISQNEALEFAKEQLAQDGIAWESISESKLFLLEGGQRVKSILNISWKENGIPLLTWGFNLYPSITERWNVKVDAHTGKVLWTVPAFCKFWNHPSHENHNHIGEHKKTSSENATGKTILAGPQTAQALDLKGVTRTINVYEDGGTFYLIDASRSMFNSSLSSFPNNAQGVIWTLDAFNTYPQNSNFDYGHITSSNNNWNNPNAVSAHYNGGKAYEYFDQTHNRNSINGQGGNIISMIRVSDPNGNDFDNAFWNGAAMFYGNGNQAFNAPLAKGLDVAGHEMSHGVIQATANLTYQKESGAMNESFADIFGAMIDRDDWFVGEDVANPSVFPSGRMRDISDPHNGGNSSNFYWQPKHMDEYQNLPNTMQGDWGGVHINSGIPNYAFFLFANNVGKDDAEDVYYEVLENYLTANSQFIDLRIAVVQVAESLLGPNGKSAAENAFDMVGIGAGQGNDFQQDVDENPGEDLVLYSDLSEIGIFYPDMSVDNIFDNNHISRPSITDDGSYMVFIDAQNRIVQIEIDWQNLTLNASFFENDPQTIWRNIAVSKDGSKLAILTTNEDNDMLIFDRVTGGLKTFELFNPTTAQGVSTGDVKFADVMDWDLSGEFVLYDAFNELQTNDFEDISYWDIGLVKVWDNVAQDFAEGQILKIFNGLQENESVGNPTFSKNSPYIISFDFITSDFFNNNDYTVLGANIENGDIGLIWESTKLGYPSFSPSDDNILFSAENTNSEPVLAKRELESDKITGVNDPSIVITGPLWGHWFANGERDLVSTQDITLGQISIFPNPTDEEITLSLDLIESGDYQLRIIDIMGRQCQNSINPFFSGKAKKEIDVSKLQAGLYFIEITSPRGEKLSKPFMIK